MMTEDTEDNEPLAAWEALLLPDWHWEAFEKEDEDLYYGRVKSPHTYDRWEWGYFTQGQLEEAIAYRVDDDADDDTPLFPDGGQPMDDLASVYETELDALEDSYEGDP